MKLEYRIVSIILFLIFTSISGSVYHLIESPTLKAAGMKLGLVAIALVIAFGIGFLLQKLGVKFQEKD